MPLGAARKRGGNRAASAAAFRVCGPAANEECPADIVSRAFRKAAATYSPTWWGSTIGASELNFSVRYGKRWILTAITTAVYYLRETTWPYGQKKDLGLLVQVS